MKKTYYSNVSNVIKMGQISTVLRFSKSFFDNVYVLEIENKYETGYFINGGVFKVTGTYESVSGVELRGNKSLSLKVDYSSNETIVHYELPYPLKSGEKTKLKLIFSTPLEKAMKRKGNILSHKVSGEIKGVLLKGVPLFSISPPFKKTKPDNNWTGFLFDDKDLMGLRKKKVVDLEVELGESVSYHLKSVFDINISVPLTTFYLEFYPPQNNSIQKAHVIDSMIPYKEKRDKNGNKLFFVEKEKVSPGRYRISFDYQIIRRPHVIEEGDLGRLNDYLRRSADFSDLVQTKDLWAVNDDLRKIVKKIVSKEESVYRIVAKLISVITENINYVKLTGRQTAIQTWERKVGDCSEHSDLLVAMLRLAKIPSGVARGVVLNFEKNKLTLENHAWVVILAPDNKEFFVDPTWRYYSGIPSNHVLFNKELVAQNEFDYNWKASSFNKRPRITINQTNKIKIL